MHAGGNTPQSHHFLDVSHEDPLEFLVVAVILPLRDLVLVLLDIGTKLRIDGHGDECMGNVTLEATPASEYTRLS